MATKHIGRHRAMPARLVRSLTSLAAIVLLAATTTVAATFAGGIVNPSHASAAPLPTNGFDCSTPIVFDANGSPQTVLDEQFQTSGSSTFTQLGPASGWKYNAIGYNPANDLIYAVSSNGSGNPGFPGGHLLVIDAGGLVADQGALTGLGTDVGSITAGAFDESGNFWVTSAGGTGVLYKIDLTTLAASSGGNQVKWTSSDITFSNGYGWGIQNNLQTMLRFDPSTGTVASFPLTAVPAGTYGAAWTYGNGNLGFDVNTGGIYQIAVINPASPAPGFTLVSQATGPASNGNDGTACVPKPADLAITKTGPSSYIEGRMVSWTLTVHDGGAGNSSGFVVSDAVPSNFTNVASSTQGCTVNGNAVQCVEGVLASGADFPITITATAHGTACVTNTATVVGNERDPATANNSSSMSTCPASLTVTKTASPSAVTTVGQTITYTFVATNSGLAPLTGVGVTDTQSAPAGALASGPTCLSLANPVGTCSGPRTALAAGQSARFTATYQATQADLDNGSVNDSAKASGTTADATTVTTGDSTATVAAGQVGGLTLMKSASPVNVTAAGQTITYTFTARNIGNVTLNSVAVSDSQTAPAGALSSGPTCQSTCSGVAPGAAATFTATYVVTQADIAAGSIRDSATATAKTPAGATVTSNSATATVNVTTASLKITKSASPASIGGIGGTVTYTFQVTNTGTLPLTGVGVTDTQSAPAGALSTGPTCAQLTNPTGTCAGNSVGLAAGQIATFTATYTATQADLINGSVNDSATASGTTSGGTTVTSTPSTASVPVSQIVSFSLSKSSPTLAVSRAGDTVSYTFLVRNAGTVTLNNVNVTDSQLPPAVQANQSAVTCTALSNPTGTCSGIATTLVPGQYAFFSATYTTTQADIDNGSVADAAVAHVTTPSGATQNSGSSYATVPVAKLSLVKSSTTPSYGAVDDTITYRFQVTNAGSRLLSGVTVADTQQSPAGQLSSGPTCQSLSSPADTCSGASTALSPGQTATFTATYAATQADLDNGSVNDSALAHATVSGSTISVDSNPSTASVPAARNATLSLTKTPNPTSVELPGQTVTYTFVATNTGNVTLSNVNVTDAQAAPAGQLASAPTCQSRAAPTATCTGASTTLTPGQSATFTATYAPTQADIAHGSIDDSAIAHGTPAGSASAIDSPAAPATVSVVDDSFDCATPTIFTAQGPPTALYARHQNAGTPTPVSAADGWQYDAIGLNPADDLIYAISGTSSDPNRPANHLLTIGRDGVVVDQGATTNMSGTGAITAGAFDADGNYWLAAATGASGVLQKLDLTTRRFANPPQSAAWRAPDITFADGFGWGIASGGTIQRFDPVTGAVRSFSLNGVPAEQYSSAWTYGNGDLGFGNSIGGIYQISVADAGSSSPTFGVVARSVVISGRGSPQDATSCATTPTDLSITKSGPASSTPSGRVTWTLQVHNNGAGVSSGFVVDDAVPSGYTNVLSFTPGCDANGNDVRCTAGMLSPGADFRVTILAIAPADLACRTNTATVRGNEADPTADNNSSSVQTCPAALSVIKTSSTGSVSAAGQQITYRFVATNTGATTLTDVSIDDAQGFPGESLDAPPACVSKDGPAEDCSGTSTTLSAGQSATFTATYTVTPLDIGLGAVTDSATATGTPPSGVAITTTPSTASVPVAGLTTTKTSTTTAITTAGQVVPYQFTVTNTGSTPLSDVSVTDAQTAPATQANLSAITCQSLTKPADTCSGGSTNLAAGQSATFTANYTVTQADLDSGVLDDSATATGTPPAGPAVTSESSEATISATATPSISVAKSVLSPAEVTASEQTVTYQFVATNTGNVTLDDVSVTDSQDAPASDANLSAITCVSLAMPTGTCSGSTTTLAPGQAATFTATYTVAQQDLDNGSLTDAATAHGTPPGAGSTRVDSDPSTASVPVAATAALTVDKSTTTPSVAQVGDVIDYSFAVTNSGNVTLHGIDVVDTQVAPATQENLSAITCGASDNPADPAGTLSPQATQTCTATYTVAQQDLDNGSVNDSAVAHGAPPGVSSAAVDSGPSTASVPVIEGAALSVTKSSTTTTITHADQVVPYSFTVRNVGNVTLHDVDVTDTQAAPADQGNLSTITCGASSDADDPAGTLSPQATQTCTANYTATQADLDRGGALTDTANAQGTPPPTATDTTPTPVTAPPSEKDLPIAVAPALTVTKTASTTSVAAAGDSIEYSFLVANSGNVTMHDVGVTDEQTAPATQDNLSTITCGASTDADDPAGTLSPQATQMCTASYTVTQADVDNGSANDVATAHGIAPATLADPTPKPMDSPQSPATVSAGPAPALTLVKSDTVADTNASLKVDVGDKITWHFALTNSGNVTLDALGVSDPTAGTVTCAATTLAPGAGTTCVADQTHTITQQDVDTGSVANTATAHGTPPGTQPVVVSAPSSVTVSLNPRGGLDLVKRARAVDTDRDGRIDTGDTIHWAIRVTDTGSTTVTGIKVDDPTAGPAVCDKTTLTPGESAACTVADHTVTAADAGREMVRNVATARGTTSQGAVQSPTGSAEVSVRAPVRGGAGVGNRGAGTHGKHGDPGRATGPDDAGAGGLASTGTPLLPWELGVGAALLLLGGLALLAGVRRRAD